MAQQTLDGDLKALLTAIEGLPPSFQSGRRSDPLGTYLTPGLSDDGDPKPVFPVDEDGLYGTFNTAWERVFQKCPSDADDKLKKLVHHGRGKHGLILAHAWAEHYATVVTSDERALIQLRAQTLLALIRANIGPTVNGGKISHLKSGLAVGINFADFIKIRGTYEYDMPFGVSYLYPASTSAHNYSRASPLVSEPSYDITGLTQPNLRPCMPRPSADMKGATQCLPYTSTVAAPVELPIWEFRPGLACVPAQHFGHPIWQERRLLPTITPQCFSDNWIQSQNVEAKEMGMRKI
ncbi:hypothetical protein GGX14DRAFT_395584 [Mycena pura]|uniref:Uncharacterized protein n=1 Tax=Mycena pura TaxID=153505 RepID=A0AAD6Y9P7_9AGAR|nr:hypothetical protein GGX14DRAFT_395584 [Mycena pura]